MTSEATKYRKRRVYMRNELDSLHKYVTTLERRIYALEISKDNKSIEEIKKITAEVENKKKDKNKHIKTIKKNDENMKDDKSNNKYLKKFKKKHIIKKRSLKKNATNVVFYLFCYLFIVVVFIVFVIE